MKRPQLILVLITLVLGLAACSGPGDPPHSSPADDAEKAKAEEAANALPRDAFYDTRPNGATPGTLLRGERFARWQLPDGATGTRIVYNSRSAQGKPVATSAAVLTPRGDPPAGGWPMVAWAHGTSGVARQCAPSLMKDLYYPEVIRFWLDRGYAVVATDYSGLGAGEGHEYLTLSANANDVRYGVLAARRAVTGLSERWVAVGHSQGGQTVWGVARQEATEPVGGFLGSVALAPVTPYDRLQAVVADHKGQGQYLSYVAGSIALQHPGFRVEDMLTEVGLRNHERYQHEGCWTYGRAISGDGTPRQLLRPGWTENPQVKQFLTGNRYSTGPLGGPIFVISGATDEDVAASTVTDVVTEQCAHGGTVLYRGFGGTHETVIDQSAENQAQWVANRFSGAPAENNCAENRNGR